MSGYGGQMRVYEGFSRATEERQASFEDAVVNAAEGVEGVAADGEWFDVVRIQAEVLPHNQYVRTFKVIVSSSGS